MGAAENRVAFSLKRATFELKKLCINRPEPKKAKVLTEEQRKKRRAKEKRRRHRRQLESRMAKLSIDLDAKAKKVSVNKELRGKMAALKITSKNADESVKKE